MRTKEDARDRPCHGYEKCKKPFEVTMTISERGKAKPTCPKCKDTKVVPQLGGFMAQTSKKSSGLWKGREKHVEPARSR